MLLARLERGLLPQRVGDTRSRHARAYRRVITNRGVGDVEANSGHNSIRRHSGRCRRDPPAAQRGPKSRTQRPFPLTTARAGRARRPVGGLGPASVSIACGPQAETLGFNPGASRCGMGLSRSGISKPPLHRPFAFSRGWTSSPQTRTLSGSSRQRMQSTRRRRIDPYAPPRFIAALASGLCEALRRSCQATGGRCPIWVPAPLVGRQEPPLLRWALAPSLCCSAHPPGPVG
jgi:hypothetical protein